MSKYYLSFHTVFVLNENIRWLEEFIIYYRNIGFDHFYLYDNEGSIGFGSTTKYNKYGFPISHKATEEDKKQLQYILEKYGDYITYTIWQPKDSAGNIIYRQDDSIIDCMNHQGKDNEWIACLDLDEYVYSVKNVNIADYLKSLDESVSCVKITQKKFLDRFLSKERFITQEFQCINGLNIGTEWGPKNIVRCKDFIFLKHIHEIDVKNEIIVADKEIIRFNHYNINDKQLKWMNEDFYKTVIPYKIDGNDEGMAKYKDLFKDL